MGCVSKSKYNDLEYELSQKEERINELEREIEEKKSRISELESYVSDLEIRANNMSAAIKSARSNLNTSKFWNEAGSDFLSTTHYNHAIRDLNSAY